MTAAYWNSWAPYGANTTAYRRNLGPAQHWRTDQGNNRLRYVHRDALGSVDALSDDQAMLTERLGYDAWGRRRDPDQWGFNGAHLFNGSGGIKADTQTMTLRGFTGHEHIEPSSTGGYGIIHMNGRTYDPETSRFMQADPFVPNPGLGQSYNRYSYVRNNPLTFTDPSGFMDDGSMRGCSPIHADSCGTGSFPSPLIQDPFASLNQPLGHLPAPFVGIGEFLTPLLGQMDVGADGLPAIQVPLRVESIGQEFTGPRLILSVPGSRNAAREEVFSRLQEMRYTMEDLVRGGAASVDPVTTRAAVGVAAARMAELRISARIAGTFGASALGILDLLQQGGIADFGIPDLPQLFGPELFVALELAGGISSVTLSAGIAFASSSGVALSIGAPIAFGGGIAIGRSIDVFTEVATGQPLSSRIADGLCAIQIIVEVINVIRRQHNRNVTPQDLVIAFVSVTIILGPMIYALAFPDSVIVDFLFKKFGIFLFYALAFGAQTMVAYKLDHSEKYQKTFWVKEIGKSNTSKVDD